MQSMTKQFLDFCRSKPTDEKYRYFDGVNCACGQFAKTLGWKGFHEAFPLRHVIEERFSQVAIERPWTFGALADRLSKLPA